MNKLVPIVLLCAGCAIGPGEPFAVISSAMEVKLDVPQGRAVPGGFYKLSTNHEVTLTRYDVYFTEARLVDLGDTASSGFDPQNPPPGYSVCHNGHCDREDGALVPYEEVAAEKSGGASSSEVVHLPVGRGDMLTAKRLQLECEESCDLPPSTTDLIKLGVERLHLQGVVRLPPATSETPFAIDITPPARTDLTAQQHIEVTRYGSTEVALVLRPRLGPALLDGAFSGLLPVPDVTARLIENLVTSTLDVDVER